MTADPISVKVPEAFIPLVMQTKPTLPDDLDQRRRRARYRAHHRGTKELDLLIGRYADAYMANWHSDDLARFERFLTMPDPMLQDWIFANAPVDEAEFAPLVADIRVFHGLDASADGTDFA